MAIEKGLLMHWWHYYGKCPYTLEELEKFEEVIDQYGTDKVLEAAIASYVCFDGSPTVMLQCIRADSVQKMFDSLPNIEEMSEDEKQFHKEVTDEFVRIITSTIGQE